MVSHKAVHHQQRSDFAAGPQRRSSSRLFEPLWQSRQRVLKGRLIGSDMNSSTHGCCCADAYLDRAVRCIEVMIHSGIGNEGDLVWEMSCEVTAGPGRGPAVVPANQNVLPSRSLLVSSYTARAARVSRNCAIRLARSKNPNSAGSRSAARSMAGRPELLIVPHDRGCAREWSG